MRKRKVSVPYGIINAPLREKFVMKIANFSRKTVSLRKGDVIADADARPKFVVCPIPKEGSKQDESLMPELEPWIGSANLNHLDERLRRKVTTLLRTHASACDGRLGTIKGACHRIDLVPGARPIYHQPYRCGIERRKAEDAEVRRMLQARVITPSNAEWASPIILVPKPDGSLRLCVDYRKLNSITLRDSYPLPRMDECIDSLGSATLFSTLDCNSGYGNCQWQKKIRTKQPLPATRVAINFCDYPLGYATHLLLFSVRWISSSPK